MVYTVKKRRDDEKDNVKAAQARLRNGKIVRDAVASKTLCRKIAAKNEDPEEWCEDDDEEEDGFVESLQCAKKARACALQPQPQAKGTPSTHADAIQSIIDVNEMLKAYIASKMSNTELPAVPLWCHMMWCDVIISIDFLR